MSRARQTKVDSYATQTVPLDLDTQVDREDVFFHLTLYNEPYKQPEMPEGVTDGIVRGIYKFADAPEGCRHRATVLFSGTAQGAAREAQQLLGTMEEFNDERGQTSIASKMTLDKQIVGVNKELLVTLENKGKVYATTRIKILGEG